MENQEKLNHIVSGLINFTNKSLNFLDVFIGIPHTVGFEFKIPENNEKYSLFHAIKYIDISLTNQNDSRKDMLQKIAEDWIVFQDKLCLDFDFVLNTFDIQYVINKLKQDIKNNSNLVIQVIPSNLESEDQVIFWISKKSYILNTISNILYEYIDTSLQTLDNSILITNVETILRFRVPQNEPISSFFYLFIPLKLTSLDIGQKAAETKFWKNQCVFWDNLKHYDTILLNKEDVKYLVNQLTNMLKQSKKYHVNTEFIMDIETTFIFIKKK